MCKHRYILLQHFGDKHLCQFWLFLHSSVNAGLYGGRHFRDLQPDQAIKSPGLGRKR